MRRGMADIQIRRLDVPVDGSLLMRCRQAVAGLKGQLEKVRYGHWPGF